MQGDLMSALITPLPLRTESPVAQEQGFFAAPLQCIIDSITKIWAQVVKLLQEIYNFVTCAVESNDTYLMDYFARIAGRRESTEFEFALVAIHLANNPRLVLMRHELLSRRSQICHLMKWTTQYIYDQGQISNNPNRIFYLLNRLAEDLAAHHLLADFSDLVQCNATGLIAENLQTFLRTEDTAPILEALQQVSTTRYTENLARHPIALPEVEGNFSRWDLLALKRFHLWYNTLVDQNIPLDAELQRLLTRPYVDGYINEESRYFARLIYNLRMNDALEPFLEAIPVDAPTVRCIRFTPSLVCDLRPLFQHLGISLSIAFLPIRPEHPLRFTQEDQELIRRFRAWLINHYPSPAAELDIERYIANLEQAEPSVRLEQRTAENRRFAALIQHVRGRWRHEVGDGLRIFFENIAISWPQVRLIPEAIRTGNFDDLCASMNIYRNGYPPPDEEV